MPACIFCKIVRQELEAEILHQDDWTIAIRDIRPQSPTHILVIPRKHIPSLEDASAEDRELLGHLLLRAQKIAREEKIASGYRLVINNGRSAGQSVFHIHLHVLGGRGFGWPPG